MLATHVEFNQISGALIGIIGNNKTSKSVKKHFPRFIKILEDLNDKMEKYSIT